MPQMIKLQRSGIAMILEHIAFVEFKKSPIAESSKAIVHFIGGEKLTVTGEEADAIEQIFTPQQAQIVVPQLGIARTN